MHDKAELEFLLAFLYEIAAFGNILEASWGTWEHLGASWGILGASWVVLGVLGGILRAFWEFLGASWGILGPSGES